MYESRFGFTATPFNLSPDPTFFFESRGHGHALSYLKFGVYQSEGFIVVTGEIGAGKTTLVRTLLESLADSSVVAAQIVSTQLEANDLLRAVATAFGIRSPGGNSKADLIVAIEAFLLGLTTQGRRALLIVDEAQNLGREAVEELRMLSNFQLGSHSLLQSFLVGQPELRKLLASKPMEQFRQRVIASCHLGPMELAETQAYVEHRLRRVGWDGRPSLSADAFRQIHAWTGGIPRRVNLLCNRLLLCAFLTGDDNISEKTVVTVARELRDEVSDVAPRGSAEEAPGDSHQPWESASSGPILFVASSERDDLRLSWMARCATIDPRVPEALLVRVGTPDQYESNDEQWSRTGLMHVPLWLPAIVYNDDGASVLAEALAGFAQLIRAHRPSAFVVCGYGNAVLPCLLAARAAGVAIVHIEGDAQPAGEDVEREEFTRVVAAHTARLFFVRELDVLSADTPASRVRQLPEKVGLEEVAAVVVAGLAELLGRPQPMPESVTEGASTVPLRRVTRP